MSFPCVTGTLHRRDRSGRQSLAHSLADGDAVLVEFSGSLEYMSIFIYIFILCYKYIMYITVYTNHTVCIYNYILLYTLFDWLQCNLSSRLLKLSEVWASWLVKLVREPRWEPQNNSRPLQGTCHGLTALYSICINRIVKRCQIF